MKTFKEFIIESILDEGLPIYHDMTVSGLIDHLRMHPEAGKHMNDSAQYDDEHTIGKGVPHKLFAKALGIHHKDVSHACDHININTDQYEGHIYNDGHHVTMIGAS